MTNCLVQMAWVLLNRLTSKISRSNQKGTALLQLAQELGLSRSSLMDRSSIACSVCKLAAFQDALPETKANYRTRYDPTEGKILFADQGGNLHEVQVILFHFGCKHTDIRSCDEDITVQMPNEAANYVQVERERDQLLVPATWALSSRAM